MKKAGKPKDVESQNKKHHDSAQWEPSTSRSAEPMFYVGADGPIDEPKLSNMARLRKSLYNKENKTCCGKTCIRWIFLFGYSIMYLIFLSAYTMIFLYLSLTIIKLTTDTWSIPKSDLYTYELNGVGLSASPTSRDTSPLLWHYSDDNYYSHVSSIEKLLDSYRRKAVDISYLGPCAVSPYGYNSNPCIYLRINKQYKWAAEPLKTDSPNYKDAPDIVKEWVKQSQKYWIHCTGSNHYDKEHSGQLKYYPDPPGIDPSLYPMNVDRLAPLVSIKFNNYTVGVSLAIECKLWYHERTSLAELQFYKMPSHIHYKK